MASCRCGAAWTGMRMTHCPGCHRTFAGVTGFDLHRPGACLDPTELGMVASGGPSGTVWHQPGHYTPGGE